MAGMPYKQLGIGVLAALVLVGGYFLLVHKPSSDQTSSQTGTSTNVDLGNGVTAVNVPPGVTVSVATSTAGAAPVEPSLSRPINIPSTMPSDVGALYTKKIQDTRSQIRTDKVGIDQYNLWLALGALYQDIGDYQGAQQAFQYVSEISPKNVVSFNNLGILYQYYLKDYPKAESSFMTALHNDPHYILTYSNLFDLYRLSYKTNTTAAADIVKLGLKNNPNDQTLLQLQSELKSGQ
jgi:hypothetical protein